MKNILFFVIICCQLLNAQITIDKLAPYDNPTFLIDNVLLGGGIVASNHTYQGDSMQIGFFGATNTSLGLNKGIVMSTGDVDELDPNFTGFGGAPANVVTDPDLLTVANSVPPLLPAPHTNSFTVSSINDVAILEFDFITTSDSLSFDYVFGSSEYFAFENSVYNDVFGFFLSGPGITGPYSSPANHPNGSVNLAIVPGSNPPLPITISSVNSVTPINAQYFVDNSNGLDTIASADGYTTVLTAEALVQCGQSYHIRIAIADGSDSGLSSFVWLKAGSFASPILDIVDDLGIDSTLMNIPCNSSVTLTANGGVGATYEWYDNSGSVISTNSNIVVSDGIYWVTATSLGCPVFSDTITVVSQPAPNFDFGNDLTIPCNTTYMLNPTILGGSGNYSYAWSDSQNSSSIDVSEGTYSLTVTDNNTGCFANDTITITENAVPLSLISGGGNICNDGEVESIDFNFNGLLPWSLVFFNGQDTLVENNIPTNNFSYFTSKAGEYQILNAYDINLCEADIPEVVISISVSDNPSPEIIIENYILYIGDTLRLELSEIYLSYEWYNSDEEFLGDDSFLNVSSEGEFYVYVVDQNGCSAFSDNTSVNIVPRTELFVPSSFTPNSDMHNELFIIYGENIRSFNITIYTKWGEVLFESNNINKCWDGFYMGKKVKQDKYLYQIDLIGEDNLPFSKTGLLNVIY
jgi:gliding motility-associated-like protein